MSYCHGDPKRDHNVDNHPLVAMNKGSIGVSTGKVPHWPRLGLNICAFLLLNAQNVCHRGTAVKLAIRSLAFFRSFMCFTLLARRPPATSAMQGICAVSAVVVTPREMSRPITRQRNFVVSFCRLILALQALSVVRVGFRGPHWRVVVVVEEQGSKQPGSTEVASLHILKP